jgi:hypothetical protein
MQDLSRVLNFIGVILNFLAGLMLAPEAIGLERIKMLENKTEVASKSILKKIETAYEYINAFEYIDWARQQLKINPRNVLLSVFIYVPIAFLILSNRAFISSWIKHVFLCLFNPIYAQYC